MAALLPVVLAEREHLADFLSLFTSLVVVLLAGGLWLALRRRRARAAVAVLAVALLLLAGAWLPRPEVARHDHVEGFVEGEARIPVHAPTEAPLWMDRGEGRLEGEGEGATLVLSCPERCRFRLGAEPAWDAGPSAALVAEPDLVVDLDGGPLQVRSIYTVCERLPALLALLRGGHPCAPCQTTEFLTGPGNDGRLSLQPTPSPVC